jgi:uncharacterized membrane protein
MPPKESIMNIRRLMALAITALALPLAALATEYRYSSVEYPGSDSTVLYAVNDRGQYVGTKRDADGTRHAIVKDGSGLALLDPSGVIGKATQSWAFSINVLGDIAGAYIDESGHYHGYLRKADGRVEVIDCAGATDTQAYGVNTRGSVIGVYNDAAGIGHAYVRRNSGRHNGECELADLPNGLLTFPLSINDWEQIAGEFIVTDGTAGYGYIQFPDGRYTLHTAPGSQPEETYYISINNRRQVLGSYLDAAGVWQNFVRKNGRYVPFNLPGSFGAVFVSAQTINNLEDVVGYYIDANDVARGFVAKARRP